MWTRLGELEDRGNAGVAFGQKVEHFRLNFRPFRQLCSGWRDYRPILDFSGDTHANYVTPD
jgi:hypothetical protein